MLDCYNQQVMKNVSVTITTRIDHCNHYWVVEKVKYEKGNDDSGKSLGQRIQNWELNEPVPDNDKYEDTAGLKKYINKWFVIPMKRTFGVASEKEVDSLYED